MTQLPIAADPRRAQIGACEPSIKALAAFPTSLEFLSLFRSRFRPIARILSQPGMQDVAISPIHVLAFALPHFAPLIRQPPRGLRDLGFQPSLRGYGSSFLLIND